MLDYVRKQISNYTIKKRLKYPMSAEVHRKQAFIDNNLTENAITKRYAAAGLFAKKGK